MHLSLPTTTTLFLSLLSLLPTLTQAHPPIFSPNHATLQKRCPPFDPAGVKNIGNGAGTQFIGGQCLSGADCASGCCANPCGICSGLGAQTQAGKTGCGFGGSGTGSASVSGTVAGTSGSGSSSTNANSNSSGDVAGAVPTGKTGSSCSGGA